MASSDHHYDAVVVGARPAGTATALLLARAGLDVLVVDRSDHGDDTLSTHALMRAGVLQLHRWGLLSRVVAAGTPAVRQTTRQVGADRAVVDIEAAHGVDALYAPRRTVLDPILADAARDAGAEIRYRTTVKGLLRDSVGRVVGIRGVDDRGRPFARRARITIGADGMGSHVARWVKAPVTRAATSSAAFAFGYWDGVPTNGYEWYFRAKGTAGAIPTNDGQTCVFVGMTQERFGEVLVSRPVQGYRRHLEATAPELADRLADGLAPERLQRFPGRPGYLRRPWGPGWALVGDAGYFKDPITAHGISDALRDAELLARAVVEAVDGDEEPALRNYEATRDSLSERLFSVTESIAAHTWDIAEVGELLLELSASMREEVEFLAALDLTAPALHS